MADNGALFQMKAPIGRRVVTATAIATSPWLTIQKTPMPAHAPATPQLWADHEFADHEFADHEFAVHELPVHELPVHELPVHEFPDHEFADHELADHEFAVQFALDQLFADQLFADQELALQELALQELANHVAQTPCSHALSCQACVFRARSPLEPLGWRWSAKPRILSRP